MFPIVSRMGIGKSGARLSEIAIAARAFLFAFVICLLATITIAPAEAQTGGSGEPPPRDQLLKQRPSSTPRLTADQLKSCMMRATDVLVLDKKMAARNAELEKERISITGRQNDLETEKRKIDRRDAKAVEAFNAKIAEVNKAQTEFNTRSAASSDAINRESRTLTHGYNMDCAGLSFSLTDERALLSELKLSANPMREVEANRKGRPRPPTSPPPVPGPPAPGAPDVFILNPPKQPSPK